VTPSSPAVPPAATALTATRRERELHEATDGRVVDVLVVGLGVTGAGVALDAAARGLTVVAVDAHDLAFGTSRWSSKLVHGGLRYLAHGELGIARESAVERGVLMTVTAPHLTRALPMLLPLLPSVSRTQAGLAAAGFMAGDALRLSARTPRATLPRPRRLGTTETLAFAPGVRRAGLRGGLLSWDGQLVDDARLVVALARTAAGCGARVLTRTRVTDLGGDGAQVRDELTGEVRQVSARTVVNATGVWAGDLVDDIDLRPSRGAHLVLRSGSVGETRAAVMAPVPGATNRYVFALPQPDGRTYVGLTDEPSSGPIPDVPTPTEAEVDFLLDVIGTAVERPLTRADVVGTFAGLRPLLRARGDTADLSRRHAVLTSRSGVVTVVGGKLTTYRRMAQDAVDAVVTAAGLRAGPCVTSTLPLVGATDRAALGALARVEAPERLVALYGTEAAFVARDPELLTPVAEGLACTAAELAFGVSHEGALDVDDLLDRRTRVGLVPQDRARAQEAAAQALASATA
jgi:glycerol-3-phosphate dehydrogenase